MTEEISAAIRPLMALASLRSLLDGQGASPRIPPMPPNVPPLEDGTELTEDTWRFIVLMHMLQAATQDSPRTPRGENDQTGDSNNDFVFRLVQAISAAEASARDPVPDDVLKTLPRLKLHHMHLQNEDKKQCLICHDEFKVGSAVVQLPSCGHVFCDLCITTWLKEKSTCPTCRNKVDHIPLLTSSRGVGKTACGAEDIGGGGCVFHKVWFQSPMVPLPNCSHVYHPACLAAMAARTGNHNKDIPIICSVCKVRSVLQEVPKCPVFRHEGTRGSYTPPPTSLSGQQQSGTSVKKKK